MEGVQGMNKNAQRTEEIKEASSEEWFENTNIQITIKNPKMIRIQTQMKTKAQTTEEIIENWSKQMISSQTNWA